MRLMDPLYILNIMKLYYLRLNAFLLNLLKI